VPPEVEEAQLHQLAPVAQLEAEEVLATKRIVQLIAKRNPTSMSDLLENPVLMESLQVYKDHSSSQITIDISRSSNT
jgi:hypothetical protein